MSYWIFTPNFGFIISCIHGNWQYAAMKWETSSMVPYFSGKDRENQTNIREPSSLCSECNKTTDSITVYSRACMYKNRMFW